MVINIFLTGDGPMDRGLKRNVAVKTLSPDNNGARTSLNIPQSYRFNVRDVKTLMDV